MKCTGYQYSEDEQENCILIHEMMQNSININFISGGQNQVYRKGKFKIIIELFIWNIF